MESARRELEYSETHASIRHLYDVRMKVFGFSVALNAALMAFAFDRIEARVTQVCVAILALLSTAALWLIERRTIRVIDHYIEIGKEIEVGLSMSALTKADALGGLRTRRYFDVLYALILLLWGVLVTLNFALPTSGLADV